LSRASHTSAEGPRAPTHVKVPPTQRRSPSTHSPTSLPHVPALGMDSSIAPSQSSSMALQVSALGPVPPVQTSAPPEHARVPAVHAPIAVPQLPPPPGFPSSTRPSQSSSIALHRSMPGPIAPTHVPHVPPVQSWAPAWHAPTSFPHGRLIPSTTPSQSSSRPLHVSATGFVPLQVPQEPAKQV